MCTGFTKRGNDFIFGFNLDVDPEIWDFDVYKSRNYFAGGVTVGSTRYLLHGVSSNGNFSAVPYNNGLRHLLEARPEDYVKGLPLKGVKTIGAETGEGSPLPKHINTDLISDRIVRGKYSIEDLDTIVRTRRITHGKVTLHMIAGSAAEGRTFIVEPGIGYKEITKDYSVISNFPVLAPVDRFDFHYGRERYELAEKLIRKTGPDFSPAEAMKILESVKQEGQWATRLSFVYSRNENCVYYVRNNDFANVRVHRF